MLTKSNNIVEYERFDKTVILFNAQNGKYVHVAPNYYGVFKKVYNSFSKDSKLESDILDLLVDNGFILNDNSNDLIDLRYNYKKRVLHITIMPTENCNFRCIYCFEKHKCNVMSLDLQESVVQSIEKIIDNYDSLFVNWYGGEPLLYIDIIENISKKLMRLCECKKKAYISSITTNAYNLTYDNYLKLKSFNIINYTITVDGIKDDHNYNRRTNLNKGDSYSVIMDNLMSIKNKEKSQFVSFIIRTNYTKRNYENKLQWENILNNMLLDDKRFKYLPRIAWNGMNDDSIDDEILKIEFSDNLSFIDNIPTTINEDNKSNIYSIILDSGFSKAELVNIVKNELQSIANGSFICSAGYDSTMTITPEGNILKCQIMIDSPYNSVGVVDIEKSEFVFDKKKNGWWTDRNFYEKCNSCELFSCCQGIGCPIKVKSPTWCVDLKNHILKRLILLSYCENSITIFGDENNI